MHIFGPYDLITFNFSLFWYFVKCQISVQYLRFVIVQIYFIHLEILS